MVMDKLMSKIKNGELKLLRRTKIEDESLDFKELKYFLGDSLGNENFCVKIKVNEYYEKVESNKRFIYAIASIKIKEFTYDTILLENKNMKIDLKKDFDIFMEKYTGEFERKIRKDLAEFLD